MYEFYVELQYSLFVVATHVFGYQNPCSLCSFYGTTEHYGADHTIKVWDWETNHVETNAV